MEHYIGDNLHMPHAWLRHSTLAQHPLFLSATLEMQSKYKCFQNKMPQRRYLLKLGHSAITLHFVTSFFYPALCGITDKCAPSLSS